MLRKNRLPGMWSVIILRMMLQITVLGVLHVECLIRVLVLVGLSFCGGCKKVSY